MTGTIDIIHLCFSSNFTGIVANKIEQSFSVSGIESIERALKGVGLFSGVGLGLSESSKEENPCRIVVYMYDLTLANL